METLNKRIAKLEADGWRQQVEWREKLRELGNSVSKLKSDLCDTKQREMESDRKYRHTHADFTTLWDCATDQQKKRCTEARKERAKPKRRRIALSRGAAAAMRKKQCT